MTRDEYLLIHLSEECAELQKAISKALRFGLENHHPKKSITETNEQAILEEYTDVLAAFQILIENEVIYPFLDSDFVEARIYEKKKHFAKFMKLSEELGIIENL